MTPFPPISFARHRSAPGLSLRLAAWAAAAAIFVPLGLCLAAAPETNAPSAAAAPAAIPPTAPAATSDATNAPPAPAATDKSEALDRTDRTDRSARRGSSRRASATADRSPRRGDRGTESASSSDSTNSTAPTTGTEFTSFKVISERNIFNPNRGRSNGRGDREAARKPTQVDLIHLVGTMSYAKGDFAFFDGSSSQYRKTLKCGETIAGYTVKSISGNSVRLEAADKPLEMQIGSQLRREDEGEWKFIARSDASPVTSSASSASSASSGSTSNGDRSSTASDSAGAANDILLKLMKKREQEK